MLSTSTPVQPDPAVETRRRRQAIARRACVAAGDAPRPAAAGHRHAGDPRGHRRHLRRDGRRVRRSRFLADDAGAVGRAVRAGGRRRPVVASAVGDVAARPSAAPRPERHLPLALRRLRRAPARPGGVPDRLRAGRRGRVGRQPAVPRAQRRRVRRHLRPGRRAADRGDDVARTAAASARWSPSCGRT